MNTVSVQRGPNRTFVRQRRAMWPGIFWLTVTKTVAGSDSVRLSLVPISARNARESKNTRVSTGASVSGIGCGITTAAGGGGGGGGGGGLPAPTTASTSLPGSLRTMSNGLPLFSDGVTVLVEKPGPLRVPK